MKRICIERVERQQATAESNRHWFAAQDKHEAERLAALKPGKVNWFGIDPANGPDAMAYMVHGASNQSGEPRLQGLNLANPAASIDRTREAIRQEMQADMTRAIDHERAWGERWHGMLHQIAAVLELPEGYKLADIIPAIKFLQTERNALRDQAASLNPVAEAYREDAARYGKFLLELKRHLGLSAASEILSTVQAIEQSATDAEASLRNAYAEIADLRTRIPPDGPCSTMQGDEK